jgi:hypothetical protein
MFLGTVILVPRRDNQETNPQTDAREPIDVPVDGPAWTFSIMLVENGHITIRPASGHEAGLVSLIVGNRDAERRTATGTHAGYKIRSQN